MCAPAGLRHISPNSLRELRHTVPIKEERQRKLRSLRRNRQGHWTDGVWDIMENEILWERRISMGKETDRASVLQPALGKSSAEILFPVWILAQEIIVFEVGNYRICMFRLYLFPPMLLSECSIISSERYTVITGAEIPSACQSTQLWKSVVQPLVFRLHQTAKSKFIPGKEQQS